MPCTSSTLFVNATATTELYTLSLHDALPIFATQSISSLRSTLTGESWRTLLQGLRTKIFLALSDDRSEEHTSELQSRRDLVCRLLLEKKKLKNVSTSYTITTPKVSTRITFAS